MKGFQKFVKQSWDFYLTALLIVLFLVICDSVYICREEGVAFTGKSIEQQVKSELAQDKGAGNIRETLLEGNKLCRAIEDKADSASVMGYYITILGIMVLLAARKYYFTDIRAAEFMETLPVKKSSRVLYDYLSMFAVILAGGLVQAGILLGCQSRYSHAVSAVLGQEGNTANDRLLLYMGIYFLFLWLAYTWIYLAMTVTRNPIAGEVIFVLLYWGGWFVEDYLGWKVGYGVYSGTVDDMLEYNMWYRVEAFMSPGTFLEELDVATGTVAGNNMWMMTGIVVLLILLGIGLLVMAAGKRDLSRGKLFYFPVLDYLFAVASGAILSAWLADMVFYNYNYEGIALVVGIIGGFLIFRLVHPASVKKSAGWEVK